MACERSRRPSHCGNFPSICLHEDVGPTCFAPPMLIALQIPCKKMESRALGLRLSTFDDGDSDKIPKASKICS